MAYSEEEKQEKFDLIIKDIEVHGKSLRQSLEGFLSSSTFYEWIEQDEEKAKRYARACSIRADVIFDEILEIADSSNADLTFDVETQSLKVDGEAIQRSRVKIDARKWVLGKLDPKKYGEKSEVKQDISITGFNIKDVLKFD